jgi:hypothetical protein
MDRGPLTLLIAVVAAVSGGCVSGTILENPGLIQSDPAVVVENPVWLPPGPGAYGQVFEKAIDIIDDYFEIAYANRYDGRIETFPRVSPGYEQFWKPGTPDSYQRLLSTLQSIRHRGAVLIQPAKDGGFFVQVTIFRELEDLPRPVRATAGTAAFRSDNTVERQFEVIDPGTLEANWIPMGRNTELEQLILQRLKNCM